MNPDPTYRRASLLAVTGSGRARLVEIGKLQHGRTDETLSVLAPAERKTLLELLSRLEEHVAARA